MKTSRVVLAVVLLLAFAFPAMAAKGKVAKGETNTVAITGDIVKDGHLILDISWMIDTAKYPGMSRDDIRKKVRQEMWDTVLANIEANTKGMDLSYDRSTFSTIQEHHDLVQTRANGTKLYSLKLKVEFTAEPAPKAPPAAVAPAPAPKKDKGFVLQQRWDNDI
ncbi:MAG: hypothetical protein WC956_08065 [bacterium]